MVKSLKRRFSRKNSKNSFRKNSKKVSRRKSRINSRKLSRRNSKKYQDEILEEETLKKQ